MNVPTQTLRQEHAEMSSYLEVMLRVADSVGMVPVPMMLHEVDNVCKFLTHELIPHARADEDVLLPLIERVTASPELTANMRRDHADVKRLAEQLIDLSGQLQVEPMNAFRANELRRLLYGLYAVLKLHFAKEEEIYLPVLDRKATPEEIAQVYGAMIKAEESAQEAPYAAVFAPVTVH